MKKTLLTPILFLLLSALAFSADYSGRVFADSNGNIIVRKELPIKNDATSTPLKAHKTQPL